MTNKQLEKVVGAILKGKYSWACVLILRYGGCNPIDYIPTRTYYRLVKDNCYGNEVGTKEAEVYSSCR
ncbi:MAG: HetP family heterocyst commitment protein [Xenococcaceae cyanobacterium]